MLPSPHQIYQQSAVNTSSPIQLVLMLYDGAIRNIKLGIESIEKKDVLKANTYLLKSQSIINELAGSLNLQYPIAQTLLSIYDYMLRKLIEANIKKKTEPASEVLEYLTTLRDAWQQVAKRGTAAPNHG
jgi:flagellar protein FliS